MKKIALYIIFILFFVGIYAQHSDCNVAKPFCTVTGEGEDVVFPGSGLINNETRYSCVDNENFSTWYKFTPTSDGIFNFTLNPIDKDDDYDWALFDITGKTCADIPTNVTNSLQVSCNSWGSIGINGATGISSANGGVGNRNGPGTTNGPPFNADLQVFAGNSYVLMVSNWSGSNSGFSMSVAGSTAEGIVESSGLSGSNVELCLGDTLEQININFNGNVLGQLSYSWEPVNLLINPNVEDPKLNQTLTQTTTFKLEFENGPCKYKKDITAYVGSIEYIKQDKNQNACVGETSQLGIDFTGVLLPSGLSYVWSPSNLVDIDIIPNPTTIPLLDTTKFYFNLKNGPCEIYDSLIVSVHYDTVTADFNYNINDLENTIPVEVDFTNNSLNQVYDFWYFGDGDSSGIRSPSHGFPGYDTYEVILIVKSLSTFCVDTAKKIIDFPEVDFPNIITPNEDGFNDLLTVTGLKFGTKLKLYNRWGKLVFKSNDYQHNWKAEKTPDGMYFYEFIKEDGETIKGWLQVVR